MILKNLSKLINHIYTWVTIPFILLVRCYQLCLSPFFPSACRFYPTCSHYAMDALKKHGFLYGSFLSMLRLLRCHPFHPGGYDPVP